jgi:predicted nucleic acid-binding protein
MSADVFIDTNVFIYHLDDTDPRKQAIAEQIIRRAMSSGKACISFSTPY